MPSPVRGFSWKGKSCFNCGSHTQEVAAEAATPKEIEQSDQ